MVLGIDASNIKAGGGFTHLFELLNHANPKKFKIEKVIVWGGDQLDKLPNKDWLEKRKHPYLTVQSLLKEQLFRSFILPKLANSCDLLFSPGGTFSNRSIPYVSMSQNMLIWEDKERNRLEFKDRVKMKIAQWIQKKSFKNAKGIIFISNYAKGYILDQMPIIKSKENTVIYHGTHERFRKEPVKSKIDNTKKIRLLYVSIIHRYKFQWNVIEAITQIRKEKGVDLHLDMVGGFKPNVLAQMKGQLASSKEYAHYHGVVKYDRIEKLYHNSDVFVFASTCENMPNILIEAMSSGCPIISSNYGPMPEILGDAGLYFDPTIVAEIKSALLRILEDDELRYKLALRAFALSKTFTWDKASHDTFQFLSQFKAS